MTDVTYADLGHGDRYANGSEIDPDSDPFAQQARDNVATSLTFYESMFDRTDVPDFRCCLHWGSRLADAKWFRKKMLLGDGDDDCHGPYSGSLSIVMHEMTHSLIESHLSRVDESMSVNEHLCDVFGILARQWQLMMTGEEPDWLFGSEVRRCAESDAAIRNMLDPKNNARDPGAATWDEARVDASRVYFNAGVLNRAFALATESIDELPWRSTGPVWHRTLNSLSRREELRHTNIPEFAQLVIGNAGEYDTEISAAFRAVGLVV